jgi:photosystem II stability/assembly factor-like uncharacterized protein
MGPFLLGYAGSRRVGLSARSRAGPGILTLVPVTFHVATGDTVVRIADGVATVTLREPGIRCLAVADGTVWAGGSRGVFRGADGDWAPTGLQGDVFSVAVGADGAVYAGCEPSALHVSDDGGASWRELVALQDIPSRPRWSFPPRPSTSHVRWIAPNPHDPGLLLVGIELGGVMRSADRGASWEDHRPGAQLDAHQLAWHPAAAGRAYEAGGGGAAWSADGGATWQAADEGRDRHYTWALAVDPDDPDCWFLSASTGPFAAHGRGDPQARIYRWRDGGPWQGLDGPTHAMPYVLAFTADGTLVAGLADGSLYASPDRGETWGRLDIGGDAPERIVALCAT